jgi:signal transduction histidine kinase
MVKKEYEKNRLIAVNKRLITARWIYISSVFLTGLIPKLFGAKLGVSIPLPLVLLFGVCAYGYNFLFYLYFRKRHPSYRTVRLMSALQLTIDQIFIIYLIFRLGGISADGFVYFIYDIIAAAFFYEFLGVITVATLSSLLYSGLIILQYFEILPFIPKFYLPQEEYMAHDLMIVLITLSVVVTSFYVVAILAGIIASNLRRKEQEILDEMDKEKAILSNLDDGLMFIDDKGNIDSMNRRAGQMLEADATDVIGKNINDLDMKKTPILDQLLKKDTKKSHKLAPLGKADVTYEVDSLDVKNEDGKMLGKAKVIHDISREKFVDKMKYEFIMIAGHQLRTPLSAIKGAFNMTATGDYGPVNEDQKKVLDQGLVYTEKLIHMVNDLLDVLSVEEGQFDYKYEKVNLANLLGALKDRFKLEADKKKLKFNLLIREELPEIMVDEYKIRLALTSIIDNAVKYTPDKGEVAIVAGLKGEFIRLRIRDTGIGIPAELQKQVFSKFFRAENALRFATEGNGLDLFVAKNIFEHHGGRIWFESETDKGTTFYIELPLKLNHS